MRLPPALSVPLQGLPDDLELHHIIVNDWERGVTAEQNVVLVSIASVSSSGTFLDSEGLEGTLLTAVLVCTGVPASPVSAQTRTHTITHTTRHR
jgi:hypothetical protein